MGCYSKIGRWNLCTMFMVSLDLSFEKEGLFAFSASVILCVRGES